MLAVVGWILLLAACVMGAGWWFTRRRSGGRGGEHYSTHNGTYFCGVHPTGSVVHKSRHCCGGRRGIGTYICYRGLCECFTEEEDGDED